MNKELNKYLDELNSLDTKFPNRHKEIHKGYCKYCPSHNMSKAGLKDPETEDLKQLPKEILAKEYVFVCAWRNNKLCKGICDEFGIDQEYLNNSTNHSNATSKK